MGFSAWYSLSEAPSCKLELDRFSVQLKIQDGARCSKTSWDWLSDIMVSLYWSCCICRQNNISENIENKTLGLQWKLHLKVWVQKILGEEKCWIQKNFWVRKKFGVWKILGPKIFWVISLILNYRLLWFLVFSDIADFGGVLLVLLIKVNFFTDIWNS